MNIAFLSLIKIKLCILVYYLKNRCHHWDVISRVTETSVIIDITDQILSCQYILRLYKGSRNVVYNYLYHHSYL
jgi:hypothetical protein